MQDSEQTKVPDGINRLKFLCLSREELSEQYREVTIKLFLQDLFPSTRSTLRSERMSSKGVKCHAMLRKLQTVLSKLNQTLLQPLGCH